MTDCKVLPYIFENIQKNIYLYIGTKYIHVNIFLIIFKQIYFWPFLYNLNYTFVFIFLYLFCFHNLDTLNCQLKILI